MSAITLIIVAIIVSITVSLVRTKLLKNAQSMGMALAQSYAMEEKAYVTMLRDFLEMGSQYVDEMEQDELYYENVQNWMKDYFTKMTNVLGEDVVDPFAVIDGQIIAQNPWEGDDNYDYKSSSWYQLALENQGEVVFTDAYQDAITQEIIFTASVSLAQDGDVLAMDIYPFRMHNYHSVQQIVNQNSSFYLSDSQGHLIYASTPYDMSRDQLSEACWKLYKNIKNGELTNYDDYFVNLNGDKAGVYYYEMDSGWMAMMTIPLEDLLMDESHFLVYCIVASGIIFIVILCIMLIRNVKQIRIIKNSDWMIQILSDSYYAMYCIHIDEGTYEVLKDSKMYHLDIPSKGIYQDLLNKIETVVEEGAFQEFSMSFSLESIRQRIQEHINDYGGDFKRRIDNDYRWVNVRTMYNEKISTEDVILCFKDIDLEKRQELQHIVLLQNALETNRQHTEAKTTFFNHMSHDMRTPLNAVLGFSKLALENITDVEKVKDYLKKIRYSGKQLLTLINDILEMSRIESGKQHLEYKFFDIEEMIHQTCSLFEERMIEENIQFVVKLNVQNKQVKGDEFKLNQILNNLLSNAFKYSESGDRVTLTVQELQDHHHHEIEFVVEDTGIGMSEQFLEHLFEPYSRETHFNAKAAVGTGLGMPIVKSLVEQMSGHISVESQLGKGTKFTIRIPFEMSDHIETSNQDFNDESDLSVLKGKRVLLVEDNDLNIEIATDILTMNQMKVIQARNGQEAIDIFQASAPFSFDLILMDMQMPVKDGYTATQEIRQLDKPDAKTVPIIALTANAFSEDIAKAMRAGMNAHVSKPIDVKVLCQIMSDFMKKENE